MAVGAELLEQGSTCSRCRPRLVVGRRAARAHRRDAAVARQAGCGVGVDRGSVGRERCVGRRRIADGGATVGPRVGVRQAHGRCRAAPRPSVGCDAGHVGGCGAGGCALDRPRRSADRRQRREATRPVRRARAVPHRSHQGPSLPARAAGAALLVPSSRRGARAGRRPAEPRPTLRTCTRRRHSTAWSPSTACSIPSVARSSPASSTGSSISSASTT